MWKSGHGCSWLKIWKFIRVTMILGYKEFSQHT